MAITQKIQEALVKVLNDPEVRKQMISQGATPTASTPQEYRQLMDSGSARWAEVLKKGRITLD